MATYATCVTKRIQKALLRYEKLRHLVVTLTSSTTIRESRFNELRMKTATFKIWRGDTSGGASIPDDHRNSRRLRAARAGVGAAPAANVATSPTGGMTPVSATPGAMEMVPPRANTAIVGASARVSSMDLTA